MATPPSALSDLASPGAPSDTRDPSALDASRLGASPRRLGRRALAVGFVMVLLLAVVASDALHGMLLDLVATAEPVFTERPVVGAMVFVGLSALSAALAFFSSGALVPVAVGVWGTVGTAALLWIGWTLGGLASYAAGRGLGRAAGRLSRDGVVARWLGRIRPDAPLWVITLLQFALQSEVSGLVLGAARYPVARYLAALAVVETVFAGLTVAAGSALVDRHAGLMIAAIVTLVALVAASLAVVHRRLPLA